MRDGVKNPGGSRPAPPAARRLDRRQGRYMRSTLLASLAAVALATGGMTAASAAPAHQAGTPAASPKDTKYPNFKGIYAFSGGHTSDLASNPDVAGRSLVYYWAQLEPRKGQ